jgi:DnaJ like chaperone protein
MTNTEIGVSITCLLLGYWVISSVIEHFSTAKSDKKSQTQAGGNEEQAEHFAEDAWHVILKVSPHATIEEIQTAYKQMIKQYHPDKVASLGQEIRDLAESKSKAINGAYAEALRIREGIA